MAHQIQQVCKSAYLQIHNISMIRPFLTQETAHILIQALVLYRLDCVNALYYRLSDFTHLEATICTVKSGNMILWHQLLWLPVKAAYWIQRITYLSRLWMDLSRDTSPVYWSSIYPSLSSDSKICCPCQEQDTNPFGKQQLQNCRTNYH